MNKENKRLRRLAIGKCRIPPIRGKENSEGGKIRLISVCLDCRREGRDFTVTDWTRGTGVLRCVACGGRIVRKFLPIGGKKKKNILNPELG